MQRFGAWCSAIVAAFIAVQLSAAEKNGFTLDDALVPVHEIRSGGPPRDGIPALDTPDVLAAGEAGYLDDDDRVLGISINGRARAYPIRIMNYHEIVNDVVGGEFVVITYCPLCGTGVAFDPGIDGRLYSFGVSGLLYNSDVLMYDRQTESLWSQIMKTAITGDMKGTELTAIPLAHTTWGNWLRLYPQTEVLSDRTGYRRNYRQDPYAGYDRRRALYFPVAEKNSAYHPKAHVLGVDLDGHFKAYPFEELAKGPSHFNDSIAGTPVTVIFDESHGTARIERADGTELPSMIAYWFAWYAFHPDTEIYVVN